MGACEGSSDGEMALFRGVVGLSPNVLRIPTPWKGLNRILSGGFYGGELVVVSGCGLDNLECVCSQLGTFSRENGDAYVLHE